MEANSYRRNKKVTKWEKPSLFVISNAETSENVLEYTSGNPYEDYQRSQGDQ